MNLSILIALGGLTAAQGKSLWSSKPALGNNILREAYQIGNGKLGGMPFGTPGNDKVTLNIDSLWAGGPFQSTSYRGDNPTSDLSHYLPGIREWIFKNGTGNVTELLGDSANYGSFQVYGNLSVVIDGVTSASNYKRSLDLEKGIHTTIYTANDGNTYTSAFYCSYPDQVCVYDVHSNAELPKITIKLENQLTEKSYINSTCGEQHVRLSGVTQLGPPEGMKYDGIARLKTRTNTAVCKDGTLVIPAGSHIRTFNLVFGADTNYDQKSGTAADDYSFKGVDPADQVEKVTAAAVAKTQDELRKAHLVDYEILAREFTLTLPDTENSAEVETSELIKKYTSSGKGDPYVESLLFSLGRHLFISSTRDNSLPPNLQGRWSQGLDSPWSGDYHANINLQMNLWGTDQTGLGKLLSSAWDYMEDTWVPRGSETAKLLYDAPGWVVHNEMNIFGHTAMKWGAEWANYPAAPAWMMQHVFDHYTYSQDDAWFERQGYPLMKGVAEFWISQLQEDEFTKDGSLVVNPCNSPEHGPTTFACTHFQQLIHQLFISILSVSDLPFISSDSEFIKKLESKLQNLDTGLHFNSWGGIKEWKLDDTDPRYPFEFQNDTHRHLSHLTGWYPGFSISATANGYTNRTIQNAVKTSLLSRGPGIGPDANAGWAKVWRSACWAMLNNTEQAHFELRYAIEQNFVGNGLSMYSGEWEPFQIDANFGLVGAVLAMLVVDLPGFDVVLGPAIPSSWGNGKVRGLRLRGGGKVNFEWGSDGIVGRADVVGRSGKVRVVNVRGKVLWSR